MYEMMLDIETLDTKPSAIVLSIGAVVWRNTVSENMNKTRLTQNYSQHYYSYDVVDRFYRVLNIDQQVKRGRTLSESTICWWATQSANAREEAFNPVRQEVVGSLENFKGWANQYDITRFWASPDSFDYPIVESLAADFNAFLPWRYNQKRDVRTVVDMTNYSVDDHIPAHNIVGTAHTPVYDCEMQIDLLMAARNKLKNRA